ncbi:M24 family metallopeptidase [Treponema sp. J25]|uniref:M24 family metallopeptidase n=1 Tax=Treponema sp. J25 TaxID=2094121 RepID=UPI00104BF538|nr:M24 family metallopeptidase [Treponema sp. J25]TCW60628.1 peptidase M24 [Treponema sp. J25]
MNDSTSISSLCAAIQVEGLDGWLFYNFKHRDPLADELLGISPKQTNSRPWIYVLFNQEEPLKIVHAIEATILDHLPGKTVLYQSQEELERALDRVRGKRLALHVDEALPVVSFVDGGFLKRLERHQISIVSAAPLIQRCKGLLDQEGIQSHGRAAHALYDIVHDTWAFISYHYKEKKLLTEGMIQRYIQDSFGKRGLITDHPPIVAAGAHSGDPHYDPRGEGIPLGEGAVIQLDLWAKENYPGAIYADISWVGVYGNSATQEQEDLFMTLIEGRERALSFISASLSSGRRPQGLEVDRVVREFFVERGVGSALKHRTGHGIDTECHGSGVNLDSVEFPDHRLLLDGSCFSIEPGLYFERFGFRTEIDVYIWEGRPYVSGKERQYELLRM